MRRLLGRQQVTGYIGFGGHANLGDDVMFDAACDIVGPMLEPVNTLRQERVLGSLKLSGRQRFSTIFLGGGTLINNEYLNIVEYFLDQGSQLATLGTGVGSPGFSKSESTLEDDWVRLLGKFQRVGVRGPISLAKLRQSGFEGGEVIGDLALALTPDRPIASRNAKRLLLNVAPGQLHLDQERLARVYSALANQLKSMTESGWSVTPMSFHASDKQPIYRVLVSAGLANLEIRSPQTFRDYLDLAQHASLSIGVRLHSSVLASMCGLPNILIGYRDKCLDFAKSIGMEEHLISLDEFSPESLSAVVDGAISSTKNLGEALHEECVRLRQNIKAYASELL